MSHFAVMVVVSPKKLAESNGILQEAVGKMLAPYQENNMGDCPKEYLAFIDNTPEYREEWENGTRTMKQLPDGRLVSPYDDEFKRTKLHIFDRDEYVFPEGAVDVEKTFKELCATFEEFCREWHGAEPRDDGRYGYEENPNRKWDWWVIGGRWNGKLITTNKLKPNADECRINQLDFTAITGEDLQKREKFWLKYVELSLTGNVAAEKDKWFGARSVALDMGLCQVAENEEERLALMVNGVRSFAWSELHSHFDEGDERRGWFDVYENLMKEDFMEKFAGWFSSLSTFAILNDDGWFEKGEMGWFGMSSETPESATKHIEKFGIPYYQGLNPATRIAVVDCHI